MAGKFIQLGGQKMVSKKVDKIAPKLSTSTPSNNKKAVDLGDDITFKFNENIQAGKAISSLPMVKTRASFQSLINK